MRASSQRLPDIQKPDDYRRPAFLLAVRAGFEPAVRLPVRQFSKLVVSATHPSHQADPFKRTGLQIYKHFAESTKNLVRLSIKTGKIMDNPFIFHDLSIKRGTFMDKTQLEMQLSIKRGIFMDKVCRKCKFSTKTWVFMENFRRRITAWRYFRAFLCRPACSSSCSNP